MTEKHIISVEFTMDELVQIIMALDYKKEMLSESTLEIHKKHLIDLEKAISKIDRPGGTKKV